MITRKWEVTVLEVVRGEQAWQMVQAASEYNQAPGEGLEYLLVRLHLRYTHPEELVGMEMGSQFSTTGAAGQIYPWPAQIDPDPALETSLYPGGEHTGWVTLQAERGETGLVLIYQPFLDFSEQSKRYLALEP